MRRAILFSTALLMAAGAQAQAPSRAEVLQSFAYTDDSRCHTKSADGSADSIVQQLIAAHGLPGIDSAAVMDALAAAAARKCDMNERDRAGLTPLAAAVVFNDAKAAAFLLKHGADPAKTIERKGSPIDGMTPAQLLDFLLKRDAEQAEKGGRLKDRSKLQALFAQHAG